MGQYRTPSRTLGQDRKIVHPTVVRAQLSPADQEDVKGEIARVAEGPGGGDTLTKTTFVQRLNTSGGVDPSTGCASSADVGRQAFQPYEADYFFYSGPDTDDDDQN